MVSPHQARTLQRSLLRWYARHRRDLPWRHVSDPYAVWISEIMLQQTTVATVQPRFEAFVALFPNVEALAQASQEQVLAAWSGLGYYARARNLHRAAQAVVEDHGGRLPDTPGALRRLPGIGRYTAGAVASIAFGCRAAVVDANVARVLSRLFALRGDPRSGATQTRLWQLAEDLVPARDPGAWNQALMELGAKICHPQSPRCDACPVRSHCQARQRGLTAELPELPARKPTTRRQDVSAVVLRPHDGRLCLVTRPIPGVWGGMLEFCRVERQPGEAIPRAACRAACETAGLAVETLAAADPVEVRHTVMSTRIKLSGVLCVMSGQQAGKPEGIRWLPPHAIATGALASPQRRIWQQLAEAAATYMRAQA